MKFPPLVLPLSSLVAAALIGRVFPRSDHAWWAYARLNPQAALARSLETGSAKFPVVLGSIGESDPILARKLLAEYPEIDEDQGIEGLTRWLASGSPEPDYSAALAWIGAASADRQFDLYQRIVLSGERKDPNAAAAAVETLPIPSEQRDRLRLSLTSNSSLSSDPIAK